MYSTRHAPRELFALPGLVHFLLSHLQERHITLRIVSSLDQDPVGIEELLVGFLPLGEDLKEAFVLRALILGPLDELPYLRPLSPEHADLLIVGFEYLGLLQVERIVLLLFVCYLDLVALGQGVDGGLQDLLLLVKQLKFLGKLVMGFPVLLVLVNLDTIVVRDLLKLLHALFELREVLRLLLLHLLAFFYLVLELINLVLEEGESLGRIIDGSGILLRHASWSHSYITGLANQSIHPLLSLDLLMMKLHQHLLIVFDVLLSLSNVPLEVQEELWGLNLLQPFLHTLMLLYQVLYGLIGVFNLLLSRADFLRPRAVWISIISLGRLLLFETLLVHLVNQKVHVLAHLLQLVSQLLILRFEILLLLCVVPQGLYQLGSIIHLLELEACLVKGLLDELVRVPVLNDFLMIHQDRVGWLSRLLSDGPGYHTFLG